MRDTFHPEWITSDAALLAAVLASVLACIVSLRTICLHLIHYNAPRIQLQTVRVLFIVPMYAVSSCLALAFPSKGIYTEIARDVYEAFVIYSFLMLVLECCGGEYQCILRLRHEPMLRHPWPLCKLKPMLRDARLIRQCKRGVLQFVIMKPAFALISVLMLAIDMYHTPAYQIFLLTVYNISYSVALYSLFLFYLATKVLLTQFKPVAKFAAVKVIVFATYYQSLIVLALPMKRELALMWNDLLLCLEMVIFAMILACAFPHKEYMFGIPDSSFLTNVKDVLNVRDIMQDVYHNFMPTYQDYALQTSADDTGRSTVRMRTFMVGNIDEGAAQAKRNRRRKRHGMNPVLHGFGGKPVKARPRRSLEGATFGFDPNDVDSMALMQMEDGRRLSSDLDGVALSALRFDDEYGERSEDSPPKPEVISPLAGDKVIKLKIGGLSDKKRPAKRNSVPGGSGCAHDSTNGSSHSAISIRPPPPASSSLPPILPPPPPPPALMPPAPQSPAATAAAAATAAMPAPAQVDNFANFDDMPAMLSDPAPTTTVPAPEETTFTPHSSASVPMDMLLVEDRSAGDELSDEEEFSI